MPYQWWNTNEVVIVSNLSGKYLLDYFNSNACNIHGTYTMAENKNRTAVKQTYQHLSFE